MKKFLESASFREFLRILLAITIGLTLGFIITLFVSDDPVNAYKLLLTGPLTRLNRIGDWLEESLTLVLLGLAMCIVFNANVFFIGIEGQMILGALTSACVALYVPLPPVPRVLLAFLVAMAVGFIWGIIPALMKAYYNANELVVSLLLNSVALKLFEYIIKFFLMTEKARSVTSDFIADEFHLPTFVPNLPFLSGIREAWMKNTNVSIMVYIVILSIIVVYYLLYKTPFGYELRTVGSNPKFARYGGINVKRTIILSVTISGIFAGLAGFHLAMAIYYRVLDGMSYGLGFEGVNIAILASNNPLGVPLASLLYGYLRAGADIMERQSDMSTELVTVIQAIILLLVTAERLLPAVQQRVSTKENNNNNSKDLQLEG